MKKFTLLLSFLLTIVYLQAQDYQISFAGTGASNTVDTVKVENLTQGKSISLSGSELLHLVATSTGLNPMPDNDNTLRIYPNPTTGNSTVDFIAPSSGATNIELFDITGKRIGTAQNTLAVGNHSFKVSGLSSGIYTIKISSQAYSYTGKIVSNSKTNSGVKISYTGNSVILVTAMKLKSANTEKTMQYTTGDRLKITGTSGNYSTVVTDMPTLSKTITFTFVACTDANGNNYPVVQIGTQVWMAENLKTSSYRNGDPIPNITDNTSWSWMTSITEAQCTYNNDAALGNKYGKLYNWNAVKDSQNIAPIGWHIPTDAEWTTLTNYVGINVGTSGNIAKALAATTDWDSSTDAGAVGNDLTINNTSGFTALPGGVRGYNGYFAEIRTSGYWWSTTEYNELATWTRNLASSGSYYGGNIGRPAMGKEDGFSVRCVRDTIPTVTDADGNVYQTVTIGTQTWMASNLRVTHYRNGESITNLTMDADWAGATFGAWCDYSNSAANGTKYGHLYNWYAVSDARNIAPVGWHVPTDAEWTTLTTYLGGENVAGGKLKEAGTLNWLSPNTGATNETGFSALPGGNRDSNGSFFGVGYYGYWWSSSEAGVTGAWGRTMSCGYGGVSRGSAESYSFSVRCIRD